MSRLLIFPAICLAVAVAISLSDQPATPVNAATAGNVAGPAAISATVVVTAPATAPAVAAAPADEAEIVEDSMHEFMEYVFQPTYRRLKASMAAAPQDNNGWKAVKSDALILAESCNLLFARSPEEDGADWNRHAAASRTHGAALYGAAKEKDFAKATSSYRAMLENCNACHRQFEDGKHILQP